jgi:hypothetical protein
LVFSPSAHVIQSRSLYNNTPTNAPVSTCRVYSCSRVSCSRVFPVPTRRHFHIKEQPRPVITEHHVAFPADGPVVRDVRQDLLVRIHGTSSSADRQWAAVFSRGYLSCLEQIRPHRRDEDWSSSLRQTFFANTMDVQIQLLMKNLQGLVVVGSSR